MIYEAQHNDKPPQNLAELVTEGFFDPSILVSPRSGNRPPLMDGSRRLQGDIDYIYIPLDSSAPADAIMAYEDPAYWRDGTGAVLFRDGHVSIMNEADFQAALKRTHEYLVRRAAGR